ncbi:MAG: type I DNA topoisomerase [Bacilli bacterium]|jgi:DNA topoisomerase-1
MKLLIVESPTKTKTIATYLGKDYTIAASKGNIRDLSTSGKGGFGIDIENDFTGRYIIDKNKKKTVDELRKLSKKVDTVIIATDPDREGEAIAWHLATVLELDVDNVKRLRFHEITKDAILEAIENPDTINMDLVASQEARRMLDRIMGFGLSNFLQKKAALKSAGRVQSAVLKIIVDKEKEIEAFIPEEYWVLSIDIKRDNDTLNLRFVKDSSGKSKIANKAEIDKITAQIPTKIEVIDVKKRTRKIEPSLPFITSSLQQEASYKFGYTSRKTMMIAQQLYEGVTINGEQIGLITYMRTDATNMSSSFIGKASNYIIDQFGDNYLRSTQLKRTLKANQSVQGAHEAIRPTNVQRSPDSIKNALTEEQFKIYQLIYARALASLMTAAKEEVTTITFNGGGNEFSLEGVKTVFEGYRMVYGLFESRKDKEIPKFHVGEFIDVIKVNPEQKFTEPPRRYSEGGIVKIMEEKGIGRPSTYATTVDTLVNRNYITRRPSIKPTLRGKTVVDILENSFPVLIQEEYTANLELKLDDISRGNLTKATFLTSFYEPFMGKLDNLVKSLKPEKLDELCPKCHNKTLVRKYGRYGPYIVCESKGCDYKRSDAIIYDQIGETCPECGSPLVERKSKYGKFISCSDYKNCDYKKPIETKTRKKSKAT